MVNKRISLFRALKCESSDSEQVLASSRPSLLFSDLVCFEALVASRNVQSTNVPTVTNASHSESRTAGTSSTTNTATNTNGQPNHPLTNPCVLCLAVEKQVACIPCGHLVTCVPCSQSLRSCPICQREVEAFVRVFIWGSYSQLLHPEACCKPHFSIWHTSDHTCRSNQTFLLLSLQSTTHY